MVRHFNAHLLVLSFAGGAYPQLPPGVAPGTAHWSVPFSNSTCVERPLLAQHCDWTSVIDLPGAASADGTTIHYLEINHTDHDRAFEVLPLRHQWLNENGKAGAENQSSCDTVFGTSTVVSRNASTGALVGQSSPLQSAAGDGFCFRPQLYSGSDTMVTSSRAMSSADGSKVLTIGWTIANTQYNNLACYQGNNNLTWEGFEIVVTEASSSSAGEGGDSSSSPVVWQRQWTNRSGASSELNIPGNLPCIYYGTMPVLPV